METSYDILHYDILHYDIWRTIYDLLSIDDKYSLIKASRQFYDWFGQQYIEDLRGLSCMRPDAEVSIEVYSRLFNNSVGADSAIKCDNCGCYFLTFSFLYESFCVDFDYDDTDESFNRMLYNDSYKNYCIENCLTRDCIIFRCRTEAYCDTCIKLTSREVCKKCHYMICERHNNCSC